MRERIKYYDSLIVRGCKRVRESERSSCKKVDDHTYVCVVVSKDFGKRDIIIIDYRAKQARSLRSTTELANQLLKRGIGEEKLTEVLDFVSNRLRALEEEYIKYGVESPIGKGEYIKKEKSEKE